MVRNWARLFISFGISSFALVILPSAHASSFVQGIPNGSYKGGYRAQDKGAVHMIVKNYGGCDGCFVAIFVDAPDFLHQRVALAMYSAFPRNKVDLGGGKYSATTYSLTPMGTTRQGEENSSKIDEDGFDGELTFPNADPSMIISLANDGAIGTDQVRFSITSAQSGNFIGITSSMNFMKNRESPWKLSDPEMGTYRAPKQIRESATLTDLNVNSFDGSKSMKISWTGALRTPGGNFIIAEKAPHVFTFNAIQYLAYGEKVKGMPTFLVTFVKNRNAFGIWKRYILMAHPRQHVNVHALIHKDDLK